MIGRPCARPPYCWRQPGGGRSRPRWVSTRELTRGPGGSSACPVIGEAFYRLNTLRNVIGLMYRRHVYSEAGRVGPIFVAKKQDVARRPGARFGSVAFVTGHLDPVSSRGAFLALFNPPPALILVLCGDATPPKSKAEMAVLAEQPGIDLRWNMHRQSL